MPLDLSGLDLELTTPDQLPSLSSMTIFGAPGSGKTTLAASAADVPELGPVLVLDFEDSSAAVAETYRGRDDIKVLSLRTWTDAREVIKRVLTSDHGYRTVILDPINGLSRMLQIHMAQRAETKRKLTDAAALGKISAQDLKRKLTELGLVAVKVQDSTNNSLGEATTSQADYGVIGTKMLEIIHGFVQAPPLAIFVTHTKLKRQDERAVGWGPDMAGSMAAEELERKPGLVGYMEAHVERDDKGNTRESTSIKFVPGKINGLPYVAKRRGRVPSRLVNPTMRMIHEHMASQSVTKS